MRTILYDPPEIEYLDGHPHAKVSPKTPHSIVQFGIARLIRERGRDYGYTGTEWRFRPGEVDGTPTEFVPDVAFVAHERLKELHGRDVDEPPFSPDIAVEVRSPGDDLRYLAAKIRRYIATGAKLVLDIDPQHRTIRAHTSASVREYVCGSSFESVAVPWLQFDVNDVFAELDAIEHS